LLVTETVEFRPAVAYFGWLFVVPLRHTLRRGGEGTPWWAPPVRLDSRAASVLGALALLAVVFGYLNTLFTQTIAFAGEEFGAGNSAQGLAGSVVRIGGIVALLVMTTADRRGRRRVVLATALAGSRLAVTGALSTSLAQLTVTQMLARGFASALLVLVTIMAAEEVPAGSRAYAVSLLAMAGGLGAGICVMALRLADLGPAGWRLLYLVPALALPALASVRHRLPESRRFVAPHGSAEISGHGGRLLLLAASGLLANLFVAPQSQFGNRFLRMERGFSGGRIGLFSVVVGTPAAIGIVVGGHFADVRGRRLVAAVALVGGTICTLCFFFATGWTVWV
ncbi:MAG: MFS transporter, partial [Acidimicrobiales bacterium]